MENATKALLIAGSVLIAILLIALGLRIFNTTSNTTADSQAAMDTTSVMTFNSQFTGYLEKQLTATQANTLAQKIIASNASNKSHQVAFGGKSTSADIIEYAEGGKQYTYETNTAGYIINIHKK